MVLSVRLLLVSLVSLVTVLFGASMYRHAEANKANATLSKRSLLHKPSGIEKRDVSPIGANPTRAGRLSAASAPFSPLAPLTAFTAANLALLRTDETDSNSPSSIVELSPTTPASNPIQTIAISGTGASALRFSGSATSTGYLASTNDGTLLSFTGVNTADTSTNVNALNPRAVGTVNAAGTYALATTYTGVVTGGVQTRGATSLNNSAWFIGDQNGMYTNNAVPPSSPSGNFRGVKSFGSTVYVFTSAGANPAVSTLSAPSGASLVGLPGLPTTVSANQDFYMISSGNNGSTYDVLYVLAATSNTAGTITKFSLVSGSWTANGSYTTTFGGFGIAAAGNGNGALLYVTTGQGALAANSAIKVADAAGYNATINVTTANNVTLYTAAVGTIIKGIAFAPLGAARSDLTIGVSGPATGTVGTPYSYTVAVGNSGAADATGVKATFTLPSGVTFNNANGTNSFSCVEALGVVTCTGGAITSGTSGTIAVSVTPTATGPVTVATGTAAVDPDSTISESNENNNSSTAAVSTTINAAPNTSPTIVAAASTTAYLNAPTNGAANVSGVINDPTDPAATLGVDFTIGDAETAASSLGFTANSLNTAVVPNNSANLVLSGSGASRNLKIVPTGVGYATITVTVTDAASATATYTISYAASAASSTPATTHFHTGTSDGSAAIAVDANFMFVGDDENQGLRLYSRANSGLPVYSLDPGPSLNLTDLANPEVDIEAATQVGSRIYWLGSHSNSANAGNPRPNRYRLFATDAVGSGASATLSYVGRYDGLRTDLINWDTNNLHGLGANRYGLAASAATGVIPEAAGGNGFNIEGLVMAPGSTTTGYVCFRAPISPASNRTKALIVPVTNFDTLVSGNPSAGPASFGAPIELDLGGRGIRDIAKNAADQYVIIAGPFADATGIPPSDFRLYTWTGIPTDSPVLRNAGLAGLNPEGIVEVPAGLNSASPLQLISDGGDTILYNDGTIAKDLPQPNFRKFRSDIVTLGLASPTASRGIVSGQISAVDGAPLSGVVVRLSGTQARKTITDTNGDYHFADLETGGFYSLRPSRANYSFGPYERSFSLLGNTTDATFTALPNGDAQNPLDTPEYFVRQQYVDILGREPDERGFNFWSEQILECGSDTLCTNERRRDIAAAFFGEQEMQQTGSFIFDVYAAALGRHPDFAEYSADRQLVVGGAGLDADKRTFAQNFVQRDEFVNKYQNAMTPESFVDALLQAVQSSGFNLNGARGELIAAYNLSADTAISRASVVRLVADNAAFKQSQYNQAFVLTEYFAYLRRDTDQSGYDFWVSVLGNGESGNYLGLVCSFITSTEYQRRFSSVVSHSNGECRQ